MEKVVHNVFRVITTILMALAVLLVVIIWAKGDTVMANDPNLQDKILNPFSWMTYVAIGIALVLVLIFPIYQIIDNPRNAMRAVLAIGLLVAIGLISWLMASDSLEGEVLQLAYNNGDITPTSARVVSAALIGTYILGGLALLTVLFSAVASMFKK